MLFGYFTGQRLSGISMDDYDYSALIMRLPVLGYKSNPVNNRVFTLLLELLTVSPYCPNNLYEYFELDDDKSIDYYVNGQIFTILEMLDYVDAADIDDELYDIPINDFIDICKYADSCVSMLYKSDLKLYNLDRIFLYDHNKESIESKTKFVTYLLLKEKGKENGDNSLLK